MASSSGHQEAKGDGETWETYAHRLEQRIIGQRDHIKNLDALREVAGDKKARAQIARLKQLLGHKDAKLARSHDGLRALKQRILELEARHSAPPDALVIRVIRMSLGGWECEVEIEGRSYGGGTGPTATAALDVAMSILYGDTNDHLNGDFGAIGELEGQSA